MKHKAFTLIELLVVISIIGILATLIINNLSDARVRARDSKRKSEVNQLKTGLRLYYNDNQQFPTSAQLPDATIPPIPPEDFTSADGNTVYMQTLPVEFTYAQIDSDNYTLKVTLENLSDPSLLPSQTACPASAPYVATDYVVCSN